MRTAPSSACSTSMLWGATRCNGSASTGCRRAVDSMAMMLLIVCVESGKFTQSDATQHDPGRGVAGHRTKRAVTSKRKTIWYSTHANQQSYVRRYSIRGGSYLASAGPCKKSVTWSPQITWIRNRRRGNLDLSGLVTDAGDVPANYTSFSGKTKRQTLPSVNGAQAGLLDRDVVPCDRNNALPFRQLDLEHHHILLAKRHLGGCEIEFPHAYEARVVKTLGFLAMRQKPFAPSLERLRVVQSEDFDVGDQQARVFDRWQYFGQGGDVTAGENIFRDPRIGDARAFGAADRMQQHNAVVG